MNQPTLASSKERGFSLLESLIGLLLFSIVILGSGAAVSKMLTAQKDMNTSFIIINLLQSKLQNALNTTSTANTCATINKDSFALGGTTYYVACATEKITVNASQTEWPVLAVSTSQASAQSCADGTASDSCYVVGR